MLMRRFVAQRVASNAVRYASGVIIAHPRDPRHPAFAAAAAMAGVLDPSSVMLSGEELAAEADLGEATKLDTFNCDLNLVIDETG